MAEENTLDQRGRATRHRVAALRRGWEPTHCDGLIRRLFVRVGTRKAWVPIGVICDAACGFSMLDPDWQVAIAEGARSDPRGDSPSRSRGAGGGRKKPLRAGRSGRSKRA